MSIITISRQQAYERGAEGTMRMISRRLGATVVNVVPTAVAEEQLRMEPDLPPAPPPFVMPDKPTHVRATPTLTKQQADEYWEMATKVGMSTPDIQIEMFLHFMNAKDWPIYNLAEVVKYMDALAEKENPKKSGWHWVPLRTRDAIPAIQFGRAGGYGGRRGTMHMVFPSSDHYDSRSLGAPYSLPVPMHALKKVAAIEEQFNGKDPLVFTVSDYAPLPQRLPDPFLQVIIMNPRLHEGIGRFVIDVWDEPGFGIAQMLK